MMTELADFELENVGPGPDHLSLGRLGGEFEFVWSRGAAVVSLLPEESDRARAWVERYDLSYPLLADPDGDVGATFGQRIRFGSVGSFSDFLGRMPGVVIVDLRDERFTLAWEYHGSSTFDRPDIDDVLTALDEVREREE